MDTRSRFNGEKYDQDGEWKCAYLPESNHYQRIGLDPEGHYSAQEIDEAYQVRLNWWKQRKKQRDKGEESNPLIKKVLPHIDEALRYLGQASACLLDPEKKRAYDRALEMSRAGEKEAKLLGFVAFTLRDKLLTSTEKRDLLEHARELGIARQRAEQLIWEEMAKCGAREISDEEIISQAASRGGPRPSTKVDPPQLVVSQTSFPLGTLRQGSKRECTFAIDNRGGGILQGNIEVSDPKWLKVFDTAITGQKHHQDVRVLVDTSSLNLGSSYTGLIYVHSNGGKSAVRIDLSIEIEKSAMSRYSQSAFWLGFSLGGVVGYLVYASLPDIPSRNTVSGIAGLVGLLGAIVVGSRTGGFAGGCGAFIIGGMLLGILQSTLPVVYSILAWATTFGSLLHTCARPLFVSKHAGKSGALVGVTAGALALSAAVIIGGLSLRGQVNLSKATVPLRDQVNLPKATVPNSSLPPLQMGTVATCGKATGWKSFVPKSEFSTGDPICVYAEALNVNRNGRIDVTFTVALKGSDNLALISETSPFTLRGNDPSSWYAWQTLRLPADSSPATYVAEVNVHDNITNQAGASSAQFTLVGDAQPAVSAVPAIPPPETVGSVRVSRIDLFAGCPGDSTPKPEVRPGERFCVSSEALDVNRGGTIDLVYEYFILAPTGAQVLRTGTIPVKAQSQDTSTAWWMNFLLPSDLQPGVYTVRVDVRNNLTTESGSKSTHFTVPSAEQAAQSTAQSTTTPVITSVRQNLVANQTITITGIGFGNQAPYNGDSPYIQVSDLTRNWNAGSAGSGDQVTLNVTRWTDNQITIQGFTGSYGGGWSFNGGDLVRIQVWNAQTGAGPASITAIATSR